MLHSLPAALLSVLGNASVLFSASRRLTPLKAPELLTVNLAVTDIGMALSMYPLSIASAFNHAWMGGDTACLYYGLMGMIFSITSIMTLAVMGMIRYLVTGSPPRKGKSGQRDTRDRDRVRKLITLERLLQAQAGSCDRTVKGLWIDFFVVVVFWIYEPRVLDNAKCHQIDLCLSTLFLNMHCFSPTC